MHLKCVYGLAGCFGLCWHEWACVHEGKLGAGGGRVEWQTLGFRRAGGGGVLGRGAAHWLPCCRRRRKKKLLMVLLHDWAFVTAIVLPATSARNTVVWASQLAINHSWLTNWRGSFKSIWLICVFVRPGPRKGVRALWLKAVPWGLLQRKVKNCIWKPSHIKHSSSVSKRIFALQRGMAVNHKGVGCWIWDIQSTKVLKVFIFKPNTAVGCFLIRAAAKCALKVKLPVG